MTTFSIACKGSELKEKVLEVAATQELADLYWANMQFNKQWKKTMQSAVMAKLSLKQLLG